jgi:flagellar motility protein MotE (MotC chaperone)
MSRVGRVAWTRLPSFGGRLRLLPLSILAMAVVLLVKLVSLVQMPGTPVVLSSAGRAMMPTAQAAANEEAKHEGTADAPLPGANKPAVSASHASPSPAVSAAVETAPDAAERALLTDLRARRLSLDDRARALDSREALAAAAERRLTDRIEQLSALQTRLEGLEQTRRDKEDANWRSLVKTYETMRPRDAATIFNDLDQAVLLQVLDRMKESKAAPILAAMQPERARLMTAELAKWRGRATAAQP